MMFIVRLHYKLMYSILLKMGVIYFGGAFQVPSLSLPIATIADHSDYCVSEL